MPQPSSENQPFNGQQMSALQKQYAEQIVALRKDVDIRKWAVDQACGIAGAEIEHTKERQDVMKLARAIHAFLTEGATVQISEKVKT